MSEFNSLKNFELEVAKGNIPGHELKSKYGRNPSVSTNSFSAIWNGGGEYTGFNAVGAELVTITSGSALDTLTGSGMRTIRLYGLDANGLRQTEDIELNGTTSVTSTLSYLRLDDAKGLTAGADGHNVSDITIRQSISTDVIFAVLPATYNSTMIACYTVPADKVAYILSRSAGIANKQSSTVDVRFKIRAPQSVFTVAGEVTLNSQGTGFVERQFTVPRVVAPLTDLFIEAEASNAVAVVALFDMLLVDI